MSIPHTRKVHKSIGMEGKIIDNFSYSIKMSQSQSLFPSNISLSQGKIVTLSLSRYRLSIELCFYAAFILQK